jgi:uncharacterized MAPEG superfamily protein
MITELYVLALAALLQCVQFVIYSVLANRQVGIGYALTARDQPRPLTGMAGRSQRALNNHFEGLILFTIAVLTVYLTDKTSGLTGNLAWAYLIARILYIPAYLFGLNPWRTVIWFVGWLATVLMLIVVVL